jgi:hypothetical protein
MSTNTNPTDATRGQSLKLRVLAHKKALEDNLTKLGAGDRSRRPIEAALSQIEGLLTGDLDRIPNAVATELNRWLEATKYVDDQPR